MDRGRLLNRHVALPGDHGSWVFLLSPLLIGLSAGGTWRTTSLYLVVAALAGFLARQPVTLLARIASGRRDRDELPAAILWTTLYAVLGLVHVIGLVVRGFTHVLLLAAPGGAVFGIYLLLVTRRQERRQQALEIAACGAMALAAPAAFWVGAGRPDPIGWWLWGLTWAQSACSIVHAYMRLRQRGLGSIPPPRERLVLAAPVVAFATLNLLATGALSAAGILPRLVALPYALQWGECLRGAWVPALGVKPARIGLRQLAVSSLFTALFIVCWRL